MYIDIVGSENGVESLTEELMLHAALLLNPDKSGPGGMYKPSGIAGIALYKLSEENKEYSCFRGRFVKRRVEGRNLWLTVILVPDVSGDQKVKFYNFLIGNFGRVKLLSISRRLGCYISVKSSCIEPHVYIASAKLETARNGFEAVESRIEAILQSLEQDKTSNRGETYYKSYEPSRHYARSSSFRREDYRVPFGRHNSNNRDYFGSSEQHKGNNYYGPTK